MATAAPPTPTKRLPPTSKPQPPQTQTAAAPPPAGTYAVTQAKSQEGERIVIYGTGAIGKSSLAALAPKPAFLDLDHGTRRIEDANGQAVHTISGITSFQDVLNVLDSHSLFEDFESIVIDSASVLQHWAAQYVFDTVKGPGGQPVTSIEGYVYGRGYTYIDEAFAKVLAKLDYYFANGKNVILVCHETTESAPNPQGEDFLRFEPLLQQPKKMGRTRDRVKNWCDILLFICYDMNVSEGKATGSGTRAIYPCERPTFWAKNRNGLDTEVPYTQGSDEIWKRLFAKD